MIVEDEVYLLKELEETVPWERYGMKVRGTAGNYQEAKEKINALRPDLVVTDIHLPGGSGLDLLQECNPRSSLVITGFDQFQYARQALRLGVVDFLLKPIDDTELDKALRKVQLQLVNTRYRISPEVPSDTKSRPLTGRDPGDTRERHVLAAENFIRRNYKKDISLALAAAELQLSAGYLSRIIREIRGCTFVEILTAYRLQIAEELLKDSRFRIGEIAALCGFRDQGYFTKSFRKRFGYTPSVFRSNAQGQTVTD